MKELKTGDWCYAGRKDNKVKRIYLGTFGVVHLCIAKGHEDYYLSGEKFKTTSWDEVHPIRDEPEFSYPMWFKDNYTGLVVRFDSICSGEVIVADKYFQLGEFKDTLYPHTLTHRWTQIPEPKIFYRWEKIDNTIGMILESNYISEEHANKEGYFEDGWTKIESSRRVV